MRIGRRQAALSRGVVILSEAKDLLATLVEAYLESRARCARSYASRQTY